MYGQKGLKGLWGLGLLISISTFRMDLGFSIGGLAAKRPRRRTLLKYIQLYIYIYTYIHIHIYIYTYIYI